MPNDKATPEVMPSKELVLAAIERAERHRTKQDDPNRHRARPDRSGMSLEIIKEHLGLPRGGRTTIQLRPCWDGLKAAGFIEQSRRHGVVVWRLTNAGQQCLDQARATHDIGALPESPQHRAWREARAIAADRTRDFHEELQAALSEAAGLLDAHETANSDTWQAIGERLLRSCRRMESASYCLHEWQEPDDAHGDIAPPLLKQRRNIRYASSR